jgi:hypothetical protein
LYSLAAGCILFFAFCLKEFRLKARAILFLLSMISTCWLLVPAAAEPGLEQPFSVSWSVIESKLGGDFWDVFFSTPQNGILVGRQGSIARTSDGGENWKSIDSGVQIDLWAIYFPNPSMGWAVGDHGTVLITRDGGATWQSQHSGIEASLVGV